MLRLQMLARAHGSRRWLLAIAAASSLVSACEKVPLVAPTGSTITLTAATRVLSSTGTTTVIAQIIEAAGTPPHSGTHVTFTTTLGRIEPSEAVTDINGRATATFIPDGANGTATIGALSGGATTGEDGALTIAVGTAAVGSVSVNASQQRVSSSNGTTVITALVLDVNGNVLVSTPVSFTTTAGTVSPSLAVTDSSGRASTTLTTTEQATVTATVGAQSNSGTDAGTTTGSGRASGSVTVSVTNAPTLTITPPATVTEGVPAVFTITVTVPAANGSPVRDVVINWGDGVVQNLGGFVGAQPQTHVFSDDGPYLITATVTDVVGGTSTVSASIVVVRLAKPAINIAASPATQSAGQSVTFTVTITPPAGVSVRSASIDYGDGTPDDSLGGAVSATRTHTYAAAGTYRVEVSVQDTAGQTSTGSISITISP